MGGLTSVCEGCSVDMTRRSNVRLALLMRGVHQSVMVSLKQARDLRCGGLSAVHCPRRGRFTIAWWLGSGRDAEADVRTELRLM